MGAQGATVGEPWPFVYGIATGTGWVLSPASGGLVRGGAFQWGGGLGFRYALPRHTHQSSSRLPR